jgi:hypothetical protein
MDIYSFAVFPAQERIFAFARAVSRKWPAHQHPEFQKAFNVPDGSPEGQTGEHLVNCSRAL